MRRDVPESPEILTLTNWRSWKNAIEKHARKEGVWEYCDPDAPAKYHPELYEPEKPHISTVRPEAESLVDLGEDDFIELSSVVDMYWRQMHAYEKIQFGLDVIFKLIKHHVDDKYSHVIKHAKTPLEQLTALCTEFHKFRLENLQQRWERIQNLASGPEVQELFERWNALFTDCDGYLSAHARKQDGFWDCVEVAGSSSANCNPLTSQRWIETFSHVESTNNGDACTRPHLLDKPRSIASLRQIKTPGYDCDRSCSPPELESIASHHWSQTTDDVESWNNGSDCSLSHSLAGREYIASPNLTETPGTVQHENGVARPRSPVKRGFIDLPHYVSDCQSTVSVGHSSLSPQPRSMADRIERPGEISGDNVEVTALLRQLVRRAEKGEPMCEDSDTW
ncbi:uncharacterized protein N7500_000393 [Penicillium coprophilum]|uniref:uncharacterized protein n=1 Tax=Penicillium coprophilum TaxID=36646 RepID=UPI0023A4176F|nr:uncharacterized protein N7500_000393 [Penicillium coprophilum]KAJ5177694.1 hypothetical protein N7500_000393 [Penicillium coprophilum]